MVQGPLNGHDQVFWLYPELELEKSKYDKEIRVQKSLITVKKFSLFLNELMIFICKPDKWEHRTLSEAVQQNVAILTVI